LDWIGREDPEHLMTKTTQRTIASEFEFQIVQPKICKMGQQAYTSHDASEDDLDETIRDVDTEHGDLDGDNKVIVKAPFVTRYDYDGDDGSGEGREPMPTSLFKGQAIQGGKRTTILKPMKWFASILPSRIGHWFRSFFLSIIPTSKVE
jgi:hypothetical protein